LQIARAGHAFAEGDRRDDETGKKVKQARSQEDGHGLSLLGENAARKGGTKMGMSAKVADRLAAGLKRFQPILSSAKTRDVNESDTSMIVSDMLAEIFGFDKYHEITRELCIRGTYCDLATKVDGKVQMIVEVKAIGIELKDQHTKQAVDYAANQGIEWVVVTNGVTWKVYRVVFAQPIDQELVLEIDMLGLNPRRDQDLGNLYLVTRDAITKSALDAYHDHLQATNKFFLAAAILSDPVLEVIRRELRRLSSDLSITVDELRSVVSEEVLKREVLDSDKAEQARKKLVRASTKMLRSKRSRDEDQEAAAPVVSPTERQPEPH
jgi:predicted type IV restriction endonuclease